MSIVNLLITRKSANVGIVIDEIYKDEIAKELYPYIQVDEVENFREDIWTIFSSIENVNDIKKYNIYNMTSDGEPDNRMLLNLSEKKIIIDQEENIWMIKYVIRMLRNLLRWQLYTHNYFYLHGGIVEIHNVGIAYLGKKKSGKTSSILSMLSISNDGKYITNDDITLYMDEHIVKLGWPRAMGVRQDTIDILKDYPGNSIKIISTLCHPRHSVNNSSNKELSDVTFFLPSEISRIFNCDVMSETKLKVIIFPKFIDKVEEIALKRLDKAEAIKYLKENIEIKPDKHSNFLENYFNIPSIEDLYKKMEYIADKIPCYELHQMFEHIDAGAKLVRNLVEDLNSEAIRNVYQTEC
jgi:hypothetical protein